MYSLVLMMAMAHNGANPEAPAADVAPKAPYGNQLATEQYRGRRRGGCGGGGGCSGSGGCSGYGGGCGGGGRRSGYAYDDSMPGGYYANQGQYAPGMVGGNQPNAQDYQSFYAGPEDRNRDMPGRIVVITHPQARVTIDGTATQQAGNVREFESPALRNGKTFTYTLRGEMPGPDGQMQTVTRKVDVRSGMVTRTVLDPRNQRPENVERTRERLQNDNKDNKDNKPEEVKPPKERKPQPQPQE